MNKIKVKLSLVFTFLTAKSYCVKKQIIKAHYLQKTRDKEIKPRVECECFSEIGKCISVVESSRGL